MIYFDSTYLGRLYLQEHGSAEVRRLAAKSGLVTSCAIGQAEVTSVFHRKFREGTLTSEQLTLHVAQLEHDTEGQIWHWLPITNKLLGEVRNSYSISPAKIFLRAADALHLACARDAGFSEVHTNDRHMLAAASHFGLRGVNVIPLL